MNSTSSKKKSPSTSGFTLATQDVMVVGEPSLMGGEFGDEDERLITRLVLVRGLLLLVRYLLAAPYKKAKRKTRKRR